MSRRVPWRVFLDGRHVADRSTRKAAMNAVDRPYRSGLAVVRRDKLGTPDRWVRRGGSWFKEAADERPAESAIERSLPAGDRE